MKPAACPHCSGKVDLAGLAPDSVATCPHCRGVFSVPATLPPPSPHAPPEKQGMHVGVIIAIVAGVFFFAVIFLGIIAAIAIPNFTSLRAKAYDASAQSAGRHAKLAEEVFYNGQGSGLGRYTDRLDDLLAIDKDLTEDPNVTFMFGPCDADGYIFITIHAQGSGREFEFTN